MLGVLLTESQSIRCNAWYDTTTYEIEGIAMYCGYMIRDVNFRENRSRYWL